MLGRRVKAIAEDADYVTDLIEFRVMSNRGSGVDSVMGMGSSNSSWKDGDEHYVAFLRDLEQFAGLGPIVNVDDDPDYLLFLDNLKESGNSYMLDKSIRHGVTSPVIYKVGNTTLDEVIRSRNLLSKERNRGQSLKKKRPRSSIDCHVQEIRTSSSSEEERIMFSQEKMNLTKRINRGNLKERTPAENTKRKKSHPPSDCYFLEQRTSVSGEDTTPDLEESNMYDRMVELLNEDVQEKRTVGEVVKRRNRVTHTNNFIEEQKSLNVNDDPKSGTEHSGFRKKIANRISPTSGYFQKDKSSGVIGYSRSDPKNLSLQQTVLSKVVKLIMENLNANKESHVDYNVENEKACYELPSDRCLAIVNVSSEQPINVTVGSKDKSKREIVSGLPSKALACNRRGLRLPPLPRRVRVATQKQPTRPSTSIVPASRPISPVDKQIVPYVEYTPRVPTNMRKKLLEILIKPYNKEEHEKLWEEVTVRTPVQIHWDSRSGGSDRPGRMGRSLLDWNPDLEREIEKVKSDPQKVLNLLRMLSFYIQKVPCGNICKPWMDDSLMTILPGSA